MLRKEISKEPKEGGRVDREAAVKETKERIFTYISSPCSVFSLLPRSASIVQNSEILFSLYLSLSSFSIIIIIIIIC
jgi:hypothetical protein